MILNQRVRVLRRSSIAEPPTFSDQEPLQQPLAVVSVRTSKAEAKSLFAEPFLQRIFRRDAGLFGYRKWIEHSLSAISSLPDWLTAKTTAHQAYSTEENLASAYQAFMSWERQLS